MPCEAETIYRHFTEHRRLDEFGREIHEGKLHGEETALIVAGVGKVNAAAATQLALSKYAPEEIFNAGVCGGCDPKMQVAELYAVDRAFQCDFDLSAINPTPRGTPNEFDTPWFELRPVAGLPVRRCASGDTFDSEGKDHDFVCGEMGAYLREMELGAIAHVCKRAGTQVRAVKAISDVSDPEKESQADQYPKNLAKALAALADFFGGDFAETR